MVELARQLRGRNQARSEMGGSVRRRREGIPGRVGKVEFPLAPFPNRPPSHAEPCPLTIALFNRSLSGKLLKKAPHGKEADCDCVTRPWFDVERGGNCGGGRRAIALPKHGAGGAIHDGKS